MSLGLEEDTELFRLKLDLGRTAKLVGSRIRVESPGEALVMRCDCPFAKSKAIFTVL